MTRFNSPSRWLNCTLKDCQAQASGRIKLFKPDDKIFIRILLFFFRSSWQLREWPALVQLHKMWVVYLSICIYTPRPATQLITTADYSIMAGQYNHAGMRLWGQSCCDLQNHLKMTPHLCFWIQPPPVHLELLVPSSAWSLKVSVDVYNSQQELITARALCDSNSWPMLVLFMLVSSGQYIAKRKISFFFPTTLPSLAWKCSFPGHVSRWWKSCQQKCLHSAVPVQ